MSQQDTWIILLLLKKNFKLQPSLQRKQVLKNNLMVLLRSSKFTVLAPIKSVAKESAKSTVKPSTSVNVTTSTVSSKSAVTSTMDDSFHKSLDTTIANLSSISNISNSHLNSTSNTSVFVYLSLLLILV